MPTPESWYRESDRILREQNDNHPAEDPRQEEKDEELLAEWGELAAEYAREKGM